MCEIYGFCGNQPTKLNKYTNEFWTHAKVHKDGFGYYLADRDQLYTNPKSAISYLSKLEKFNFTSKLVLCHIRFKTHGPASVENCHPFIKRDVHNVKWSLIHNGYIGDNEITAAFETLQNGETDSERILLAIVEAVNSLYEHSWLADCEILQYLYAQLEAACIELSKLGKTNLIFTDSATNNMYVFMNSPRTLHFLQTEDGVHISTTPLTNENWMPVDPYKLHIINNGEVISSY